MSLSNLDHPLVLTVLFHPRQVPAGGTLRDDIHDGTLPVERDVVLGYRLYVAEPAGPVLLYFHGNGEIAADHDDIALRYHRLGATLLVVDYRGYGWSTGQPRASVLLSDAAAVAAAIPNVLQRVGLAGQPLFGMGRSLGSACAIHAVWSQPALFKGLILESGFAEVLPLLARLGLPQTLFGGQAIDPLGNLQKLQSLTLPLLVIHGERDDLIPIEDGQALFAASPARLKRFVAVARAGHNDLMYVGGETYFTAVGQFITEVLAQA